MLSPPLEILRRALKLSAAGGLDEAIDVLNQGIALCEREPEHLAMLPRLISTLGLFYRRADRPGQAISAVQRALLLCPQDRQLLYFLADLVLESGDVSGAALTALELRLVCERNPETFSADWAEALALLENRITAYGRI